MKTKSNPKRKLDFSNVRHELSDEKDLPLLTFAHVQPTNPKDIEIGNKGSLGTILSIAGAIALPALAPFIPGLGFLGSVAFKAKWYAGIVTAGLGLAGGFIGGAIGNLISPPLKPSFGNANVSFGGGDSPWSDSPTFSLTGIQNTRTPDGPIPIVYGERRIGGILISQRLENVGDDTFLWVLFALCEGEVESICAAGLSDLRINGQSGANFDDVTLFTRTGIKSPTVIPGFEELISTFSVGTKITSSSVTYTTNGTSVIGFKLDIQASQGLFSQNAHGGIIENSVVYQTEYRVNTPPGSWVDLGNTTITAGKIGVVKGSFTKDTLTADKYDIKVTRISAAQTGQTHRSDIYLIGVDEMSGDQFLYPHTALAGVKVKATNQLNGPVPTFTFLVKGSKVLDVNNLGNPKAYSTNPANCYYDLLTNARYGLGRFIGAADVNATKLATEATFFDTTATDGAGGTEIRAQMDMVIDTHSDAQQLLMQMMSNFRSVPLWSEGLTSLVVDKSASHVHIFNMGNVIQGSYASSFPDIKASPNRIVVQYADKTNDYKINTVSVTDDDAITNGAPIRTQTILAPGVVRKSEAYRYANYKLNLTKFVIRALEFAVPPEAIDLQAGDLFLFQHDVPQWGNGGRIENANGTTIVVDQELVIGGGSYVLQVRLPDGTLEEKVVINSASTTKVIELSSAFTTDPGPYAPYFFGTAANKKVWTCTSISMDMDGNRKITGIEYDANVYIENALIPTHNASDLISPETIPPDVTNLTLLEGGDKVGGMIVSFNLPSPAGSWNHGIIYLSTDGGNTYLPHTPVQEASDVQLNNLIIGQEYYVKLVSYTLTDVQSSSPPVSNVTITGSSFEPQVIRALEIIGQGNTTTFNGRDVTFEWKSNNPIFGTGVESAGNEKLGAGSGEAAPTFRDFKIDIYVSDIIVRTTFHKDTKWIYTHQMNIEDNGGLGIRAFQIRVSERNGYNSVGPEAVLDVSNPIPDMSAFTPTLTTNHLREIIVDWNGFSPSDADLQLYKVYVDTSNPPTTLVGEVGSDTKQFKTEVLLASTLYYAKIIPHDVFGAGTVSGIASITSSAGVDTPDIVDNAVTNNGVSLADSASLHATTWTTLNSFSLSVETGQPVAVWAKLEVACFENALVRIIHNQGGTNVMDSGTEISSDGSYHPISLLGVHNPSGSATVTYSLQTQSSSGTATIGGRVRRLVAIRLKK